MLYESNQRIENIYLVAITVKIFKAICAICTF